MSKKLFLGFFLLLFFSGKVCAQVNVQTGSATFSVPMFNWQDDKSRLNAVVALSYTSGGGLKVNDIASSVGQGWSMVAGGAIVRMQVGEPDDQYKRDGNGTESDLTRYPSGILYATKPAYDGCPTALTKYPIYGWKNQQYTQHNVIAEDKQLDYFSFQFNGKAGMFVLDPTNIGAAQSLGDTKMLITFQQDANLINSGFRTRISSFTIKDVDGLIYRFANQGVTKVLRGGYCDESLNYLQKQPKFNGDKVYHQSGFESAEIVNPFVISSWYLTEIEDALTHRKVLFNYITRTVDMIAGQDIMYNWEKNYTIISHKRSISYTPVISSIVYPDGHTATFNYGADRFDMPGDKILSSVDFTYQGRYLSKYLLNTSYFILNRYGNPVTAYQKKASRLCLRSVQKIGIDLKEDTPPYIFDYYIGSSTADDFVPPPFFYAKDIWGFYNGNNSIGYWSEAIALNSSITSLSNNQLRGLCFSRNGVSGVVLNPKTNFARNGLLKQVIYPTGGTLTYDYQQNTGILNSVSREVGGVHVSQTSSTDGGYSNNCANPLTTKYDYVMNGTGSASSLWGLEMPDNSNFTSSHYQPEYRYYKWSLSCVPFGCCAWKFQYPGILSMQQAINLNGFQKFMESAGPVLGIVSIVSNIMDVVNLCVAATPWNIVAVVIDVVGGLVTLALTCIGNQARDSDYTVYYNSDLNGVAPLPAQFKRVEIVENPGTIGKTVQEFTSSDDYAVWEPTNPNLTAKQRFAPWAYGLPKKTTVYNAAGNIVKQTENVYNFSYAKNILNYCSSHPGLNCNPSGLPTTLVSCKCEVVNSSSQRNTTWSDPAQYNDPNNYQTSSNSSMKVEFYPMYTGRVELTDSYERIYSSTDPQQFTQVPTRYTYNLDNYEVKSVTTIQSNGDKISKYNLYSSDFSGGVIDQLKTNNMVSVSVATGTLLIPTNSFAYNFTIDNNTYYFTWPYTDAWFALNETATEFSTLPSGDIKPYRIIEQRFDKPQPTGFLPGGGFGFLPYAGLGGATDYSKYKQTQTFTYGNGGNLEGLKDEGGRTIANMYGYNDKYIVASLINAEPVIDKYAYASFEDAASGWIGWTLNVGFGGGSPTYNSTSAVTGSRSVNLTSSISYISSVVTGKPHVVSFWATNGTTLVNVTGGTATLTKSAPTINGFTYYEYEISQGASSVTVTGGNASVDELRLYPKTARMRSTTYDPLIGKTSECDENNRVVYYEYDKLGRLLFVKDEYRNIVKMYEYNNISSGKQNGCPGTYSNKLISEVYTRNNCGAGYIGGNVTYTVPANMFTSAISQQDADAQAEAYLLTNGQAYANSNGSCILLYYNTQQSQNFTTESCGPGYIGGVVTYTVPAGRYSSTVSQAAANQKALDEIAANGDAYANSSPNAICTPDATPLWIWQEGAPWYCAIVSGYPNPHLFIKETDINPSSPTYMQTRWSDAGESDLCPPGSGAYYNTIQSGTFTRNNCPQGYVGSQVIYTVPQGMYSSTISQAQANQLAINDVNSNGQNYANTNGTCTVGCDPNSCTGEQFKCVNNVCEQGVRVNTDTYYNGSQWVCIYHYEFSDGSWSDDYYMEYNSSPCY